MFTSLISNGLANLLGQIPQNSSTLLNFKPQSGSAFIKSENYRSPYGYCGICNLGATCYINSML